MNEPQSDPDARCRYEYRTATTSIAMPVPICGRRRSKHGTGWIESHPFTDTPEPPTPTVREREIKEILYRTEDPTHRPGYTFEDAASDLMALIADAEQEAEQRGYTRGADEIDKQWAADARSQP